MPISLVAVGDKIKATVFNTLVKAVNQQGLTGIIPTGATGTGVTVAPTGAITIVNGQTMSISGVFTGGYDNYRITWSSSTRSAVSSIALHLLAAGTASASNYDFVRGVDSGTSTTITSSSATTAPPIDYGIAVGQRSNGVMDIFGPALIAPTASTVQSAVYASSNVYSMRVGWVNEANASYDGISLFVGSGQTWSGTVRIYGYNNLA